MYIAGGARKYCKLIGGGGSKYPFVEREKNMFNVKILRITRVTAYGYIYASLDNAADDARHGSFLSFIFTKQGTG